MDTDREDTVHNRPTTDPRTARRMARQRRRDTAPEVLLRHEIRTHGLGYRVDSPLPGLLRRRCDIMFKGARVAVFVDGYFWHGCPEHGTTPRNNGAWWAQKLQVNVERDRDTDRHLAELGWTVIRAWEHEDMSEVARRIATVVRKLRNLAPTRAEVTRK